MKILLTFIPVFFFILSHAQHLDVAGDGVISGNLGIGTSDMKGVLHLHGSGSNGAGSRIIFGDDKFGENENLYAFIGEFGWENQTPTDSDKLQIHGYRGVVYTYNGLVGNVNIGMTMNNLGNFLMGSGSKFAFGHKLSVDGKIASEEVRVQSESAWPDYVFSPSYKLLPLSQVESFIDLNHHLPGIPSAKTVEEEGFELGSMSAKLLEKIEEITLHVIRQEKEIDTLKKIVQEQQELIIELKEEH